MNAPIERGALSSAAPTISLDDKYTLERGTAFMSGTHALVRLPMLQRERDLRAGLNTAGFISGYRGSPLGALDQNLWKAKKHLEKHHVHFAPGLNEDLAATAVWGSQQVNMYKGAKYDGVFGLWYGKGPGVDRTGDVFKHANAAGSSKHGGVLVLAGDDHGAKSSTLPHQSDHIFKACGLPVFYPASVQEYLDLGLHAWAMSRYSGLWAGMKTVTEVVEASARVELDADRVSIILPEDFAMPSDGLNIRWPDTPLEQEARLLDYKFYAALAYVRANKLNRTVLNAPNAWFGIMTAGKAYLDTRQALNDLGLDDARCQQLGIRLFKCDVVWPLEAQTTREFATGLQEILVVEEKRQLMEYALKEELYNWRDDVRPKIYGKFDERDGHGGEWSMPMGRWLLPAHAELSPALIAKAIAARLLNPGQHSQRFVLDADTRAHIEARLAIIDAKEKSVLAPLALAREQGEQPSDGSVKSQDSLQRVPTFCSGCPHNTSTRVPEGSRAVAGIGCHYMVTWMPDRNTSTFTQMGGEGVPWIGQSPFTDETHIFANLGDGTYFHSGLLAIRASIAAKVNITYKILYNDAVAMTGGQPIDGTLTVPQIIGQLKSEGAVRIDVVTDEPEKYEGVSLAEVRIHHRDYLDAVQRELREVKGCTVLVYDQTCATEKRRRRKKILDGKPFYPDPAKRLFINEAVCEGCGDCSTQSSCVSIEPKETLLGRKRVVNQSSCNKDFSCQKGFCPSFVSVLGGSLKKPKVLAKALEKSALERADALPLPSFVNWAEPNVVTNEAVYGIIVTGVGGTGVVTIGQLLGMAAHVEGKGVSVLDMAGLAQKGGAVFSHVQLAHHQNQLHATRIAAGDADLVIGCDAIVSVSGEALSKMRKQVTRAVVNIDIPPSSDFLRNPDWAVNEQQVRELIQATAGERDVEFVPAISLATTLLGDAIYTNPFMLGFAWQKGWIPLALTSITEAIELNGIAVEKNLQAFAWGRLVAHDPSAAQASNSQVIEFVPRAKPQSLPDIIAYRSRELTAYQNPAYAKRYVSAVERIAAAEAKLFGDSKRMALSTAVAKNLYKLMAYKDEYEVARLYTRPEFKAQLDAQFEGEYRLEFNLAPPLLSKFDAKTGRPSKIAFGGWMMNAFRVLAKLKFLRGTALDVFGRTSERQSERAWIERYFSVLDAIENRMSAENYAVAMELAKLPEDIRGYGPVKEQHLAKVEPRWATLMVRL